MWYILIGFFFTVCFIILQGAVLPMIVVKTHPNMYLREIDLYKHLAQENALVQTGLIVATVSILAGVLWPVTIAVILGVVGCIVLLRKRRHKIIQNILNKIANYVKN